MNDYDNVRANAACLLLISYFFFSMLCVQVRASDVLALLFCKPSAYVYMSATT